VPDSAPHADAAPHAGVVPATGALAEVGALPDTGAPGTRVPAASASGATVSESGLGAAGRGASGGAPPRAVVPDVDPLSPVPSAPRGASGAALGEREVEEAVAASADGLFTYCLSVLCAREEAAAAVRAARELALRHRRRLRRPELLRAWLYALAREACVRRLESAASGGPSAGSPAVPSAGSQPGGGATSGGPSPQPSRAEERAQLALLSWPEAAGATPEQREVLELVVRHRLSEAEAAAVLGAARPVVVQLLAQGVCEVERTRAVLAALEAGACTELVRLAPGPAEAVRPVLGPDLRAELVRHVDGCPACRAVVERAASAQPWPGTPRPRPEVPLVPAPAGMLAPPGARGGGRAGWARAAASPPARVDAPPQGAGGIEPRLDRNGFPVHRSPAAARVVQLRNRALTTTIIAAVVAGPSLALWGAHREEPSTQPIGAAGRELPGGGATSAAPSGGPTGAATASASASASASGGGTGGRAPARAGRLAVEAQEFGGRVVITLVNDGSGAAGWWVVSDAPWLRLSRASGTLGGGERVTVLATVDQALLPAGPWTARIEVQPTRAAVTVSGFGGAPAAATVDPASGPSRPPAPSGAFPRRPAPGDGPRPPADGRPPRPGAGPAPEPRRLSPQPGVRTDATWARPAERGPAPGAPGPGRHRR